jgi:hypothetical protein
VASGLYIVHVEAFGPLPAGVATRMAHRPSEVKVMKVAVVR